MMKRLTFLPAIDHPDLISSSVLFLLKNWQGSVPVKEIEVAEIDPKLAGGNELCRHYEIPLCEGANCVIVEASRSANSQIAACVAPVGCRIDFNGVVRKTLNARRVSLADLDQVLQQTGMEYGSITPIGLPADWTILIDQRLTAQEKIVIGSGLLKSKLRLPSKALIELPLSQVVEKLAL